MRKQAMEIVQQEKVGKDIYRLTLAGGLAAVPGQFVQVGVSSTADPLLKRPFSIHYCNGSRLVLLYQVTGRGTNLLAAKKEGEILEVTGPLGRGFPLPEEGRAVVVAGGMGAAPLYYLLHALKSAGRDVTFLYGARTAAALVLQEQYRSLVRHYAAATDDGSFGRQGPVTELLQEELSRRPGVVFACGPEPMLREAAAIAAGFNSRCFVSLEARMACGVGACLGCVIPGADGRYRRVCADGPVFAAEEVFPA